MTDRLLAISAQEFEAHAQTHWSSASSRLLAPGSAEGARKNKAPITGDIFYDDANRPEPS